MTKKRYVLQDFNDRIWIQHPKISIYTVGWFKNIKVKLETKTPPNFFTLVICIILRKFQLPTPTGRRCSITSTYSIVFTWKHRPNVLQIVITLATFLCNYAVLVLLLTCLYFE